MNGLSILTTIENNIKALDVEALKKANTAKQSISDACKFGVQIGELLKEAQTHTGRNNYKGWLIQNFGEDFAKRSVKYRRVADDPKQMALALGVVATAERGGGGNGAIKAKPASHLVYTNKLGAYLRKAQTLSEVDVGALKPIVNDLKRLGLC